MRFLFIVTESESANGICTKTVMEQLVSKHHVWCITNREYNGRKYYEEKGVRYLTVAPRLIYRFESMIAHGHPCKWLLARLVALINKPKLLLTICMWPWISPMYTRRIFRKAFRLCTEKQIDCIVPIYTQIDTLIAAKRIKEKIPSIRFVPYFLDSLSGGYGPRFFSREWICARGQKWERKILPSADEIIVMESSRAHHMKYSSDALYYDKMHFFDLPLLRTAEMESGDPLMDAEKRNFVYVGTLPDGIRSPAYVLEMFSHLHGEQWQFWFVGSSGCAVLEEAALTDRRIHIVGRVPHELALRYEAQADVLVNIGNSNPHMTPSKIFEYFSFGKPILSTRAIEGEPSSAYLARSPLALILDEVTDSPQLAATKVEAFVKDCEGCAVDPMQIRQIYYNNTPGAVVEFLQRC